MSGGSNNVQNLSSLQRSVLLIEKLEAKIKRLESAKTEPIAIIGMSCRFPGGADNPQQFWKILYSGIDAVTDVPANRWNIGDYYDENPQTPGKIYTKSGGFLSDVDQFDPHFFGISAREAVNIDPQHRLLLEVTWEALENAGCIPQRNQGSPTGVFVGITLNDYGLIAKQARSDVSQEAYGVTGSPSYAAAGRISYTFGFTGPCMAIDTACSSSLVAIHQACQSLRQQECQMAIAGGVNLILLPDSMIATAKAGMLSPDGRCKTFDATADGIGRGEGCGILVLKRLSDAQADGDNILAVIRGSAVNQDGPSSGLTVPNGASQQQVMRQALKMAQIEPAEVTYVEAHGTGTPLGDPIELRSLAKIYGSHRSQDNSLFVGSAKTNISHVETAAGVAGVIKVILQLQHQQIAPHLHLKNLTNHFNWEDFPLVVPTQVTPWLVQSGSRIGVVNSFGATGTNAHIVLAEAPAPAPLKPENSGLLERSLHLLTLSTKTEPALKDLVNLYQNWVEQNTDLKITNLKIADICYSANTGRAHFKHRLALLVAEPQELAAKLQNLTISLSPEQNTQENSSITGVFQGQLAINSGVPKIAFLFTGQGSQYIDMGRELYQSQSLFRRILEQCDQILRSELETPLLEILYPQNTNQSQTSLIDQTNYTQPALFALEYALAQLWISWGIKPAAVMGHSLGEYVAACIAGVFSLEDGLKLIAARGRLMQSLPQNGAMLAVFAEETRVTEIIAPYHNKVAISAYNGAQNIVISGENQAIAAIKTTLEAEAIESRPLKTSHAFHSPLVDPILEQLEQIANQIEIHPPRIPIVSNLTGETLSINQPLNGKYWRKHSREAVKFTTGLATLVEKGYETFLEIGAKPVLSKMGHRCKLGDNLLWLASLVAGQSNWATLLNSLAQLYVRGAEVNWSGFDRDYPRQRLILPNYPFQRQRYWLEIPNADTSPQKAIASAPMNGQLPEPVTEPVRETIAEPTPEPKPQTSASSKQEQIIKLLQSLIAEALQTSPDTVDIHTPLVEMGADSIVFMETGQQLETTFGVRIPIRRLFEDLSTLNALGTYIAENLPAEFKFTDNFTDNQPVSPPVTSESPDPQTENKAVESAQVSQIPPTAEPVGTTAIERIMSQQLQAMSQLMSEQLAVLRGETTTTPPQFIPNHNPVNSPQTTIKNTKRQEFWERREYKPTLSDIQDQAANFAVTVPANKQMQFSLYYFGSYDAAFSKDKYSLLFGGVEYADQNGFTSVWLPERHFHAFGGFSPNPSILCASLAKVTKNIQLRAGSVVLPLHHPVRVAEDWAIIDNISQGRVGISFASGWHPHDFVFAPEAYDDRREIMFEGIETVQKLWRGESIQLLSGSGNMAEIRTFPMPQQKELPVWVTIVNNPDTYMRAGALGIGVLTNLMGQTVEDLARNIAIYRESLARHGFDPSFGQVTVLLHTFMGTDLQQVRETARKPFQQYLTSSIGLFQALVKSQGLQMADFEKMSEDDKDYILSAAYDRYVQTSALIGTPDSCLEIVEKLLAIGVDEIACLIDFGVEEEAVLASLPHVKTLKERVNQVKTDDWFYGLDWQQEPRDLPLNSSLKSGHWLIFADVQGVGTALAQQLQLNGQTYTLIYPQGSGISLSNGDWEIDPTDSKAFNQLLQNILQNILQNQLTDGELPLSGVIYLWSLNSPLSEQLTVDLLQQTQETVCGGVLHLVQALDKQPELKNACPQMWLITQQAVASDNTAPTGIAQASLWGFGRVIALEYPELWGGLIDIDRANNTSQAEQIWLEIRAQLGKKSQAEDQVLLHQEKRYVARLVRQSVSNSSVDNSSVNLDLDGTYLITGGLGALGIRLAQWLVDQGVRHLVLCGRSAPAAKMQKTITQLQEKGIQVMVAQVDISKFNDLSELLEQIQGKNQDNWPPLQGIFHLAGLLDDGALFQQTWKRFDAVFAPKILGTWNLHVLTQDLPLKHFVLFSSIASLLGSPGQANHAAANAFIDALAHYRRANGLPAVSINWGSWTEIGKVTRLEGAQQQRLQEYFDKLWRSYGMEAIAPKAGLHALEQLLNQPPVKVGVFPIDWPKFCESLGVEQKPLLLYLTQPETTSTTTSPIRIPLSEAQKQLWLLAQIVEEGSIVYNDNVNLELRGDLHLEILKQSIQTVVERHEALRTVIDPQGEWQEILPTLKVDIPLVDLSSTKDEQEQCLQDWLIQRSQKPLNLTTDPLFQVEVLKLGQQHHVLVITVHHIISDGWSIENILKEIALIYSALGDGADVKLNTPLQFRQFLHWQTNRSQSAEMLSHESFWLEQFADSIPVLELPTDRPRPLRKTYHGNRQTRITPPQLREQLRQFSQGQGCTLFMTLLAAHFVLLHRLSRQAEIVVGIPTAGRFLAGSETMVGYATHLLPIRSCFPADLSFSAYLAEIRSRLLAAYEHQDYPFAQLLKQLNLKSDSSRTPLVSVTFNLEPPVPRVSLKNLDTAMMSRSVSFTHFDLHFVVIDMGDRLILEAKYNTDLFNDATIERWLGHFQTLLEEIITQPNQEIATLPVLTQSERQQLLMDWNAELTQYSSAPLETGCVYQRFEKQVSQNPDALAVVFANQQLTYQELNTRANQLAVHLRNLNIPSGGRIVLYIERSLESLIAILGIWKAGGVYIPLDAANTPPHRLALLLEDIQPTALLTQTSYKSNLPTSLCCPVVFLDKQGNDNPENQSPEILDPNFPQVTPDDLAYIIFTSGSTGQPKGVAIKHRHLSAYTTSITQRLGLQSGMSFATVSTFAADLGYTAIFPTLCTGGTLHIITQETATDPQALATYFSQHQIDCLKIVPAHLNALLEGEKSSQVLPQHTLVLGGDTLTWDLVGKIQTLAPQCRIFNHYGPSETTVGVLTFLVDDQHSPKSSATVPLGRPLPHVCVYILDQYQQPVPIGVPGELYIGGASVAPGYLNRPELTTEKFILNPYLSNNPNGDRLYKTGDLARYLPDGNIEFLGRIDNQVKIRGYRLELGEVESVLNQHPGVQQAVVLAWEQEQTGEKRLVAYWVAVKTEGVSVSSQELRQFLQAKLPDYMIPSSLIRLENIPLTANGKIDSRALPLPEQDFSQEADFIAPRTPTEQAIADIFATVLRLESVGINNNFFELGGHSLLATQVISRLRETFQIDLPLVSLFTSPTVAGIDLIIHQQMQQGIVQTAPVITAVPRTSNTELPLSWSQERLWFIEQLEGANATYNMPAAVRLQGNLNISALEQALGEIVKRHEVLRTGFKSEDGKAVQVILRDATLSLQTIDLQNLLSSEQEISVQKHIIEEAKTPFDLSQPPLMRATLLQLHPQSYVILITMHHIVSDGWSVSIVVRELSTIYQAFAQNRPSPLPDLSIQYADFTIWQRQWLTGEVLQNQLNYWQNQLALNLPILNLPLDYPLSAKQDYRGAQQNISIERALTQALKAFSDQEGVTLFMTLFAAFNVLLSRHTGQEDIIIGSPIAGRNHLGSEDLVGFFINTLPLRTNLAENPSFRQLLKRVREVTLGAYTYQDIPFEKLVEELRTERVLNRHPLFDVLFNFVNIPEAVLNMGDLTFERLPQPEPYSKFWLTFYIRHVDEALNIQLVYRQSLFTVERMKALLEQFVVLLTQVVENPDETIQSYSLLSPQSAALIPDPSLPLPEPDYELVTTSFINWAKKSPEQIAIRQNGKKWTYGELATAAENIAQVLMSRGLKQKDVVALWGERSFGLIAGVLGIFLAGGVLLIIDSNLPPQRQNLMLEQTQARYLISIGEPSQVAQVVEKELKIIAVNSDTAATVGETVKSDIALPTLAAKDPAYIFFTSGSTGTPKGVLGNHQGIAHFIHWQRQTFEIKESDRIAQLIGLSFDAILRDIFLPLTSGATLCLPDQDYIPGSPQILTWLDLEQISVFHTVPAIAQSWLQNIPEKVTLSSLRWVFLSGEPLTQSLVQQWRQTFPQAGNIVNLYGATETTMVKCFYPVPPEIPAGVMPGGWPLSDTQILILNSKNQLCGIGEIGEIVVRTPFRTLGYIKPIPSPFVLNPFRQDPQDWVYYTGDNGRYRPDGSIEVLGRLDNQIKIRGVRVQPGEIEAILNQHPAVGEGVVIAKQIDSGEYGLVAYIVLKTGQTVTNKELRKFLKKQLPEYMVPFSFVQLDNLPLTATGKVNRQLLPEHHHNIEPIYEHRKPRTSIEVKIVEIIAQVLKLEQIGIDDNFFELGGHSLLAAQVISRLQQEFQVKIPLKSLFEMPSPAQLATLIEKLQSDTNAASVAPKITKVSRKRYQAKVSDTGKIEVSEELKQEIFKSNE